MRTEIPFFVLETPPLSLRAMSPESFRPQIREQVSSHRSGAPY